MNRLTYDDDLFLRMETVLDVPVVNQIVWRFDEGVPEAALKEMWHRLGASPINRVVTRVRVPGARDRWTPAPEPAPMWTDDAVVSEAEAGEWMVRRASVSLDPFAGPVWQLAYARTTTGGALLSLVASHVVGDGGALTSVAIAALEGTDEPEDFRSAWNRDEPGDLADAAAQFRAAAVGTARALAKTFRRNGRSAKTAPARKQETRDVSSVVSGPFEPSTVVVDCPTEQWASSASAVGGSANSLLVGIALGILTASGRVDEADAVKVSLPVSTRVAGDVRANATSGVSIHVSGGGGYRRDLGAVRRDSKSAFSALSDASHATTFELTKPLMQMLPDFVVEKAAASGTAPLCLCSNLGNRGALLRDVGGVAARSVAMRSITQNATVELLRRTRGGVSVWWNTSGDTVTLCVTGLDPDRFPTAEHLRSIVGREYERWQLTPTFW